MKYRFLTLILLSFSLLANAQETGTRYLRVNFKDKGQAGKQAIDPYRCLSPKAVEKRMRHNIPVDNTDLPVVQSYVNAVLNMGCKETARSRWFNYIVVEANGISEQAIAALPFIASVKTVLNNRVVTGDNSSFKPFFQPETFLTADNPSTKSFLSGTYNYGIAANQINMLHGEYLHDRGFSGQGMTIAVLDAGFCVADTLMVFDSLFMNGQIKGTRDFVQPGNNVFNANIHPHGTMVLSTMGGYLSGQIVGTAPKADYWLIRTEDGQAEYILEEYFWVSGAEFADSLGVDVINSSLGYSEFDDPATNHTYSDMDGNTTWITRGADKAAEKGILVVSSAGNSGSSSWNFITAPADGDSVFTIGAVDAFGNYASFSSNGPTYDGRVKPTVAAQGQGSAIYSQWGLGYGGGTSFSSPIMAGMSTCLMQSAPEKSNMDIINALIASASKASSPDTNVGYGIPDFSKAFNTLTSDNNKFKAIDKLRVYPNPFISQLNIESPMQLSGTVTAELCSINGRCIFSRKIRMDNPGSIFSLDALPEIEKGTYLLKVISREGIFSALVQK